MKAQALALFPMTWLTCIALVIFFSIFVTKIFRVFTKSNRELYRQMELLPLSEEGDCNER